MAELGHVVFYVRELKRSVRFYTEVVGLTLAGEIFAGRGAILSGGRTHHELLLIEIGLADGPAQGRRLGLYHVGWKIGETLDALRELSQKLADMDYPLDGMSDHLVSQSLYLRDPDGNEVELYVDDPSVDWRSDKSWMEAPVLPLKL